jgi:hypothetical protein
MELRERLMGQCKTKQLNQAKEGIQKKRNSWEDIEEERL